MGTCSARPALHQAIWYNFHHSRLTLLIRQFSSSHIARYLYTHPRVSDVVQKSVLQALHTRRPGSTRIYRTVTRYNISYSLLGQISFIDYITQNPWGAHCQPSSSYACENHQVVYLAFSWNHWWKDCRVDIDPTTSDAGYTLIWL